MEVFGEVGSTSLLVKMEAISSFESPVQLSRNSARDLPVTQKA